MKVTDMTNLWFGYNEVEDFRVLICAQDEQEARQIANGYRVDTLMEGTFEITEFDNTDLRIDCDYVLTYNPED